MKSSKSVIPYSGAHRALFAIIETLGWMVVCIIVLYLAVFLTKYYAHVPRTGDYLPLRPIGVMGWM